MAFLTEAKIPVKHVFLMADSLEDKPFPELSEELQKHTFWEFGSIEEHFKYRDAVIQTYIYGSFPVFEGFNYMQYQIRDPEGFAHDSYLFTKSSQNN